MKLLRDGAGQGFIFRAIVLAQLYFLVKILLFKLKNLKLNLRYNKVVTQLGHFSSSQLNCKTI